MKEERNERLGGGHQDILFILLKLMSNEGIRKRSCASIRVLMFPLKCNLVEEKL